MVHAIGGGLAFAGFALFVLSIVALVRPIASFHLGSRKRATVLLVGSMFVMGVGGALNPQPVVQTKSVNVAAPATENPVAPAASEIAQLKSTPVAPVAQDNAPAVLKLFVGLCFKGSVSTSQSRDGPTSPTSWLAARFTRPFQRGGRRLLISVCGPADGGGRVYEGDR